MPVYFQITTSENSGPKLFVDAEEAKSVIESMAENAADGYKESYFIKTVEMTKEEFENLDPFDGF